MLCSAIDWYIAPTSKLNYKPTFSNPTYPKRLDLTWVSAIMATWLLGSTEPISSDIFSTLNCSKLTKTAFQVGMVAILIYINDPMLKICRKLRVSKCLLILKYSFQWITTLVCFVKSHIPNNTFWSYIYYECYLFLIKYILDCNLKKDFVGLET